MLDGWRLLEKTAVYRPSGKSVLHPEDEEGQLSIGQAILLPKTLLARRVLADSRIQIYPCGRTDIETGRIDRRILAAARVPRRERDEPDRHLAAVRPRLLHDLGQRLPSLDRAPRSTSRRSTACRSSAIRRPGGVTDRAVRAIMRLQGAMAPAQIISLLDLGGATFAMGDHHDHIHVGYQPGEDAGHGGVAAGAATAILEGSQWDKVVNHVGAIRNPRIKEDIDWHDPANLSCKYKRAIAAQGSRAETKPLKSLVDLAAADKPLLEVVQLDQPPRPCFGFGTPGTL